MLCQTTCCSFVGVEYLAIDAFMQRFHRSWHDAPIECNRAFIARFKAIFNAYILSENGIVGNVLHYARRFESQARGSLHAHVLLWVADTDIARIERRIVSCIPAPYNSLVRPLYPTSICD